MTDRISTPASPAETTIEYLELYVADLDRSVFTWVDEYAFTVTGTVRSPEHRSVALRHGGITLVLTQATSDTHPAAAYVLRHGDGVADIALGVPDPMVALDRALAAGAELCRAPAGADRPGAVGIIPGLAHTLVHRGACAAGRPPGFSGSLRRPRHPGAGIGLLGVDHVTVCLPAGGIGAAVAAYGRTLGLREVFGERIRVGAQTMGSTVVQDRPGGVTLTLIEPDPSGAPGQADEFLKDHQGPGVQHVAFTCHDAVRAVRALSRRGVSFLNPPPGYHDRLAVGGADPVRLRDLRDTGVLADEDGSGGLFQIFTASRHPRHTLFFELIERRGEQTFASANIHALYQAVEFERTGHDGSHR